MKVREARPGELPSVATVLDAAMLETEDLRERVAAGDVLVAVEGGDGDAEEGDGGTEDGDGGATEAPGGDEAAGRGAAGSGERVLGALVLEPPAAAPGWARERGADAHVAAVAVRRRRRGQGIGTALIEAAAARADPLTAAFDADRRPFYEALGFDVEPVGGRLGGIRRGGGPGDRSGGPGEP